MERAVQQFQDDADRSDDDISTTSTSEPEIGEDDEWDVKEVLTTSFIEGQWRYLIEWLGFPLWEASWEPLAHMNADILATYEAKKTDQENGLIPEFDGRHYKDVVMTNVRAKHRRHDKRNERRRRLGLEETVYATSIAEHERELNELLGFSNSSSDNESPDEPADGDSDISSSGEEVSKEEKSTSRQIDRKSNARRTSLGDAVGKAKSTTNKIATGHQRSPQKSITPSNEDTAPNSASPRPLPSRPLPASPGQMAPGRQYVGQGSGRPGKTSPVLGGIGGLKGHKNHSRSSKEPTLQIKAQNGNGSTEGTAPRKKRRTLVQQAKDPTVKSKMLRPRLQNLIQKHSRDVDGLIAPAQMPHNLMSLDPQSSDYMKTAKGRRLSQQLSEPGSDRSITAADNHLPNNPRIDVNVEKTNAQTLVASTAPSGPEKANQGRLVERRKSVRFADDVEIETGDLFVVQDSLSAGETVTNVHDDGDVSQVEQKVGDVSPLAKRPMQPILKSASVQSYVQQTSTKSCSIVHTTSPLPLVFNYTTHPTHPALVAKFNPQTRLDFHHSCNARTFTSTIPNTKAFDSVTVASGSITSESSDSYLQQLTDRLRIGSLGLLSVNDGFCVVIYSSECEDWKSLDSLHQPGKAGAHLHFLALISPLENFWGRLLLITKPILDVENAKPLLRFNDTSLNLFGTLHNQLVGPECLKETISATITSPAVFLVFPRRASSEEVLVSKWVCHCWPESVVRTSSSPGHWLEFLLQKSGIFIIHEDAVPSIRRIPRFRYLLHGADQHFTFWVFTRSLDPLSLILTESHSRPAIRDLALRQVFRLGTAILLMPSFIVSQPGHAYQFMKWYWQCSVSKPNLRFRTTLFVCDAFDAWLSELIDEKAGMHSHLQRENIRGSRKSEDEYKSQTNALIKMLGLVRSIFSQAGDTGDSRFIAAPSAIDGNDEQSLLNWFGWWATTHMEEFQKFTCLGSTTASAMNLKRMITPPVYDYLTTNNPDAGHDGLKEEQGTSSLERPLAVQPGKPPDDSGESLRSSLISIIQAERENYPPVTLFNKPVSYWADDMASHFREFGPTYASFTVWFKFFYPLRTVYSALKERGQKRRNTCAGLFYTVDGKWDPAVQPPLAKPVRSPWIALYRPVNVYMPEWSEAELLIWDPKSTRKFAGRKVIYEEDLTEAQVQLVQHIIAETAREPSDHFPLKQVWLGGFERTRIDPPDDLAATIDQIQKILSDAREYAPAPEGMLGNRGWKPVRGGKAPTSFVGLSRQQAGPDIMDLDQSQPPTATPLLKMIFQPPRGNRQYGSTSKCKNRLFDAAKNARGQIHIPFDFIPTTIWYNDQLIEGRGFEHIEITSWESVFQHHKISAPKQGQDELRQN